MDTKEALLRAFFGASGAGGFISGQELAARCGVSRTSVWKAVESLRRDGARIAAVTRSGYRLLDADGLFCAASVRALLPESSGVRVEFFRKIDSTNTEAKRRLAAAPPSSLHKTVIVAASQTAGRGRSGRNFYSPDGSGIYLSIIYSSGQITEPSRVTASAAVGVCRALSAVYGAAARIKWVNDVFVRGRKVCGILTEGTGNFETGRVEAAVIGIGVNIVRGKSFPDGLKDTAGGVLDSDGSSSSGKSRDDSAAAENRTDSAADIAAADSEKAAAGRSRLTAAVITEVLKILDGGSAALKDAMAEYQRRSMLTGMTVEVFPLAGESGNSYLCTAEGVTDDARLIVRTADGRRKILDSGEVSVHSGAVTS